MIPGTYRNVQVVDQFLYPAPGEFAAQCLQEIVFVQPDEVDAKSLFPDSQLHFFCHDLTPAVECAEKTVRTSFEFKGDDGIVGHHNRPDVQVMRLRGHGGDDETAVIRKDHRTVAAQGIAGGAGGVATISPSAQ